METLREGPILYRGRIDFGHGAIDASALTEQEFLSQIENIRRHCLVPVVDYRDEFGGCMDGRNNDKDETGAPFVPRPKLIGGPNVFAWYAAYIGQFSIVKNKPLLEGFRAVTEQLTAKKFKAGMHYGCGAAASPGPITETYAKSFDEINHFVGQEANSYLGFDGGRISDEVQEGVERMRGLLLQQGGDVTPDAMMGVVREIGGPKSLIYLAADPNHANGGHNEGGLLFMRADGYKVDKPKALSMGPQLFINNSPYATRLIHAIANTENEFKRGMVISDQLPLAGVGTLGTDQHVGELLAA